MTISILPREHAHRENVLAMRDALEAGAGGPLKIESLERTLRLTTFEARHLWKFRPRKSWQTACRECGKFCRTERAARVSSLVGKPDRWITIHQLCSSTHTPGEPRALPNRHDRKRRRQRMRGVLVMKSNVPPELLAKVRAEWNKAIAGIPDSSWVMPEFGS